MGLDRLLRYRHVVDRRRAHWRRQHVRDHRRHEGKIGPLRQTSSIRLIYQPSIWNYLPIPVAAITILLAIGLLVRNNTVRGIVNFFSAIKLLYGLCAAS